MGQGFALDVDGRTLVLDHIVQPVADQLHIGQPGIHRQSSKCIKIPTGVSVHRTHLAPSHHIPERAVMHVEVLLPHKMKVRNIGRHHLRQVQAVHLQDVRGTVDYLLPVQLQEFPGLGVGVLGVAGVLQVLARRVDVPVGLLY